MKINIIKEKNELAVLYNKSIEEINLDIQKTIEKLSGLIDDDAAIRILKKNYSNEDKIIQKENSANFSSLSDIINFGGLDSKNSCLLLDVDKMEIGMLDHFKTHKRILFRYSANKNSHVILFEHCDKCILYNDELYLGKVLFDNKGKSWASNYWTDINSSESFILRSIHIIHLLFEIQDTLYHFYLTKFDQVEKIINIHDVKDKPIYFTFHSILENKALPETWSHKRQSKDHKTIAEFISEFLFKRYTTLERMKNTYKSFLQQIPNGFKYYTIGDL